MNVLTKYQLLLTSLLLLVLLGFVTHWLFFAFAVLVFATQVVFRRTLKAEYPEDWKRYFLVFIVYQLVVVFLIFAIHSVLSTGPLLSLRHGIDVGRTYSVFALVLALLVAVALLQMLFRRAYCFGTVLFSAGEWAGVEIKSDLLSRIQEGNYAVKSRVSVKKGDRVRVSVEKGIFSKPKPYAIQAKV